MEDKDIDQKMDKPVLVVNNSKAFMPRAELPLGLSLGPQTATLYF